MKDLRNRELTPTGGLSYDPPQAVRLSEARSAHGNPSCISVGQTDISCSHGKGAQTSCFAGNNALGCATGDTPRF